MNYIFVWPRGKNIDLVWPRGQSFGLTWPLYQNCGLGLVTLASAKALASIFWPLYQS